MRNRTLRRGTLGNLEGLPKPPEASSKSVRIFQVRVRVRVRARVWVGVKVKVRIRVRVRVRSFTEASLKSRPCR